MGQQGRREVEGRKEEVGRNMEEAKKLQEADGKRCRRKWGIGHCLQTSGGGGGVILGPRQPRPTSHPPTSENLAKFSKEIPVWRSIVGTRTIFLASDPPQLPNPPLPLSNGLGKPHPQSQCGRKGNFALQRNLDLVNGGQEKEFDLPMHHAARVGGGS